MLEIGATALEELQIGRNAELGDGGGIAIADAVRGGALRTLGAAGCAFGDGAAAALAASSAHLVVLDLGSSRVGATGAAALLASPSLQSLRLFDNPAIGAGAAAALVPALCHGARALESLDLGACALDASAIVALCAALRDGATAPALQTLELFGNEAAKGLKAELDAASGWLFAEHLTSRSSGYVPTAYLAFVRDSLVMPAANAEAPLPALAAPTGIE